MGWDVRTGLGERVLLAFVMEEAQDSGLHFFGRGFWKFSLPEVGDSSNGRTRIGFFSATMS